jgi:hypothetical protein
MNAHRTKTKKSSSKPNTVECSCSCGWETSVGFDDWRVSTMREVWREVGYLRQDHKDQMAVK